LEDAACPPPWFFISVHSKGLKHLVSSLESTFTGHLTSVVSKRVKIAIALPFLPHRSVGQGLRIANINLLAAGRY
jgi:hypothetical protein